MFSNTLNVLGLTLQDRDHTDRHYNILFAEQLTRIFEVLVISTYLQKLNKEKGDEAEDDDEGDVAPGVAGLASGQ